MHFKLGRKTMSERIQDVMELARIASPGEVTRNTRRNLPWIMGLLAAILIYSVSSTFLMWHLEKVWSLPHTAYFTAINVTTVGFGDVVPATHAGKVLAGVNGFAGLLLFGAFVAAVMIAFQANEDAPLIVLRALPQNNLPERAENEGTANDTADLLDGIARLLRRADEYRGVRNKERASAVRIEILHHEEPNYVSISLMIDPF